MKNLLIDIELLPEDLAAIRALPGVSVTVTPAPHDYTWRELDPGLLRNTQILLCKYPPKNFAELTNLEWMQIATVGFEHLAHLNLDQHPLRLTNARGIFDSAIGEWNVAMMINLVRDLPGMFRHQQQKIWSRDARFQQEIRNKTVGIWGYGGIGRETARLARALGMRVHVQTRTGIKVRRTDYTPAGTGDPEGNLPHRVFLAGQEQAFLQELDFLILAFPRNIHTLGRIGVSELQSLKPTAFLLNVARGPVVQEEALLRALREGWIAGAALDVHYAYPLPPEHPLWEMPNVILTPHISGCELSSEFLPRIGDLFRQNLQRYLQGIALLNEVTRDEIRDSKIPS